MIRIAIADNQTLLRDMMRVMLVSDPEIEVVGSASEGSELLRICLKKLPDIALVDICISGTDGIQVVKVLKKQAPQIKVIILTAIDDEDSIIEASKSEADGYILKDIRPQALILAVKCIYEGLFVMHQNVHQKLTKQVTDIGAKITLPSPGNGNLNFGKTDLEIIRYLAKGYNNREIAANINFSEGTIKNRISRLLSLTGFKDRSQIVVFALKNRLI